MVHKAEVVRGPLADGTVMKASPQLKDTAFILMAGIFPTGFFGASNEARPAWVSIGKIFDG
jgi:hypothetical protein